MVQNKKTLFAPECAKDNYDLEKQGHIVVKIDQWVRGSSF